MIEGTFLLKDHKNICRCFLFSTFVVLFFKFLFCQEFFPNYKCKSSLSSTIYQIHVSFLPDLCVCTANWHMFWSLFKCLYSYRNSTLFELPQPCIFEHLVGLVSLPCSSFSEYSRLFWKVCSSKRIYKHFVKVKKKTCEIFY